MTLATLYDLFTIVGIVTVAALIFAALHSLTRPRVRYRRGYVLRRMR